MRSTLTCPKCRCRKLWRMHPVMLPQFDSSNSFYPMPVACRSGSGGTTSEMSKRMEAGTLEAWICSGCGLTEWYSANVNEALGALSRNPASGVSYVDGDSGVPYR